MNLQDVKKDIFAAAMRQSFALSYYALNNSFCSSEWRNYTCNKIQGFLEGKKKYLFVNVPTQHGKSELCSSTLPAWILGNKPDTRIIIISHAGGLAQINCAKCYNLMQTDCYKMAFESRTPNATGQARVFKEQNKQNFFRIAGKHGYYYAAGFDGGVTGMAADLIIIDDAYSNISALDSQTIRAKTESTYDSAVMTRMTENTKVIVVNSRMGANDLQNYALKKLLIAGLTDESIKNVCDFVIFPIYKAVEPVSEVVMVGDNVHIIETGAESYNHDQRQIGQLLDPRAADKNNIEVTRIATPHVFNALYAQNPSLSLGGGAEWFNTFDEEAQSRIIKPTIAAVPHLPYYLSFDFNVSPYTCVIGQASPYTKINQRNPNHYIKILDVIQVPQNLGGINAICKSLLEKYKGHYFATGDNSGYNTLPIAQKINNKECKNMFEVIQQLLPNCEIKAPKAKLSYQKSNELCNKLILTFPKLEIARNNCMVLINDLLTAKIKQGTKYELLKDRGQNKQDAGDAFRYFIDTFYNV